MISPTPRPASDLRTKLLNQGDVKGYRVARFSENPPTTRVVIDLNSPQHYQIFPDGKTVIVKLKSDQTAGRAQGPPRQRFLHPGAAQARFKMEVEYNSGRLSIRADHASLAQILNEVQRQTGTDITIPPGAAQEQIVAGIGPLPLREALVSLLNGSRFNFIMVDSEREPGKLKSVILTYRGAGGISQPAIATPEPPVTDRPARTRTATHTRTPQPEMQPQTRKAQASRKPRRHRNAPPPQ